MAATGILTLLFVILVFLAGRLLPLLPKVVLPFLDLLSPLPMMVSKSDIFLRGQR